MLWSKQVRTLLNWKNIAALQGWYAEAESDVVPEEIKLFPNVSIEYNAERQIVLWDCQQRLIYSTPLYQNK